MTNASVRITLTCRLTGLVIATALLLPAVAAGPASSLPASEPLPDIAIAYEINLGKTIRSHLHYVTTASVSTNPDAILLVKLSPAGEVMDIKIVRSSGIFGFDSAIKDAIRRSAPFPKREDGVMPGTFRIHFWLK